MKLSLGCLQECFNVHIVNARYVVRVVVDIEPVVGEFQFFNIFVLDGALVRCHGLTSCFSPIGCFARLARNLDFVRLAF